MSRNAAVFAAVGVAAVLAGTGLWLDTRPSGPPAEAPAAVLAASFHDLQGRAQSLGQFPGKVLVVNFWATWCAPCRAEIPALARVQSRWGEKVQLVGLSSEEPARIEGFTREVPVNYPLWIGGDEVPEAARRLGNEAGVLPYTVVLSPSGAILTTRVGPYTETGLSEVLAKATGIRVQQ